MGWATLKAEMGHGRMFSQFDAINKSLLEQMVRPISPSTHCFMAGQSIFVAQLVESLCDQAIKLGEDRNYRHLTIGCVCQYINCGFVIAYEELTWSSAGLEQGHFRLRQGPVVISRKTVPEWRGCKASLQEWGRPTSAPDDVQSFLQHRIIRFTGDKVLHVIYFFHWTGFKPTGVMEDEVGFALVRDLVVDVM